MTDVTRILAAIEHADPPGLSEPTLKRRLVTQRSRLPQLGGTAGNRPSNPPREGTSRFARQEPRQSRWKPFGAITAQDLDPETALPELVRHLGRRDES